MGVVYIARAPHLSEGVVVVKKLRPDAGLIPSFPERFRHEGTIALRLDHPNIVRTLDAGEIDGVPFIASELVSGQDVGVMVDRIIEHQGLVSGRIAVRILLDVLSALAYVHTARESDGRQLRLVHRDVTPGNVLVGYDGRARLADFGLAKSALVEHMQLTGEGMILGTPAYLAPEVVKGHGATALSDIYGLAAVMYRLLTGLPPYSGDAAVVLHDIVRGGPELSLAEARPDLPAWLTGLVTRMMSHEPAERTDSAGSLWREVRTLAQRNNSLVPSLELGSQLTGWFKKEREELEADLARYAAMSADTKVDGARFTMRLEASEVPLEADDAEIESTVVIEESASYEQPLEEKRLRSESTAEVRPGGTRLLRSIDTGADLTTPSRGSWPGYREVRRSRLTRILVTAAIVLIAAAGGLLAGSVLVRPQEEDRRMQLAERLGQLQYVADQKGGSVSSKAQQLLTRAARALREGDLQQATTLLAQCEMELNGGRISDR